LNLARDDQAHQELNLRRLLSQLARADLHFVVIGSSALAIQGWEIAPGDLDLLTRPDYVEPLAAAVGADVGRGKWVSEGAARRFECITADGHVDLYVEVSGGLTFDDVHRQAAVILISEGNLSVRAGTPEHVRDMRAAVGRAALPTDAVAPAARSDVPKLIAIDGPAGAGKSTVTRALAKSIGFTYLDTGAMYRCVTLAVFNQRADTDDARRIGQIADSIEISFHEERVFLNGKDVSATIRTPAITDATPYVAAYPEVRDAMVRQQRQLFSEGSYVVEGRDTTTVVAPDAPLKIYLTASLDARARRRAGESGESLTVMLGAIEERDRLDSDRELSALRIAEDAVVLDTTGYSVDEVVGQIATLARERGLV
jgi:cytidylate kinase